MRAYISLIALTIAAGHACAAQAYQCVGPKLRFRLQGLVISEVQTKDEIVRKNLIEASQNGLEMQDIPIRQDGFNKLYDGVFTSPSPIGFGSVQLLFNSRTGQARLIWDDDDGSGRTYELTCRFNDKN